MGSGAGEAGRESDEGPVRKVALTKPFYMGIYEVTQEQYNAVMGNNPSNFSGLKNPVETVSWNDAMKFCEKMSQVTKMKVTLPTEAQWEYACRAGSQTRFSFGDNDSGLAEYAWYDANSGGKTYPVGQKKPNKFGLYDMHGNVWEWCLDWYQNSYSKLNSQNPNGPTNGSYRVLRGGCWISNANYCRSTVRSRSLPGNRLIYYGFRVVLSASSQD